MFLIYSWSRSHSLVVPLEIISGAHFYFGSKINRNKDALIHFPNNLPPRDAVGQQDCYIISYDGWMYSITHYDSCLIGFLWTFRQANFRAYFKSLEGVERPSSSNWRHRYDFRKLHVAIHHHQCIQLAALSLLRSSSQANQSGWVNPMGWNNPIKGSTQITLKSVVIYV